MDEYGISLRFLGCRFSPSVKSFLDGVEEAKRCKRTDIERLRALIAEHQLVREHIPTELLDSKELI
jgi:hypothetical protein